MMLRAYLTSFLLRKYLVKRAQALDGLPNAWLVWEAGAWTAPTATQETVTGKAQIPRDPRTSGDALCYGIPTEMVAAGSSVLVGRAPTCDLVINDATVSREHLLITRHSETWVAQAAAQSKPLVVRGSHLSGAHNLALADGDRIGLGEIELTFYEKGGLLARLDEEMKRQLSTSAPTG